MNISFLGDISLNDAYVELSQKGIKPFTGVKDTLFASDLVVGNLESMVGGEHGENVLKIPRLKTTSETLKNLKELNMSLTSLAHNHVYDNLLDGFQKTLSFLKKNQIAYLGAGMTAPEAAKPSIIKLGDVNIVFFNYVTADTNPKLPEQTDVVPNFFSVEKAVSDIRRYRAQADHIVLLLHWGGRFEGGYYPDYDQLRIAHELIDAGADLIVGGHSHTLQPHEVYKGKHIFYSLGNFCFADIAFEDKVYTIKPGPQTESIIVTVDFKKDDYAVSITPIANKNLHLLIDPAVMVRYNHRLAVYNYFYRHKFFWRFYWLHFLFVAPAFRFLFNSKKPLRKRLKELNAKRIAAFSKEQR